MLSNFTRLKILRRKTNLCLIHRTISTGGFQWDIPEKFNFAQDVIDAYAKGGLIWEHTLALILKKCVTLNKRNHEFKVLQNVCKIGLNQTWHMSFLPRQNRTLKFSGPDWNRTYIFNILPTKYGLTIFIR